MRRVLWEWHDIKVHAYPALLYLGVVCGVLGGAYAGSWHGLDPAASFAAMLLLVAPALIGARLLYVASHWSVYRCDLGRIWRRTDGGAAMYGGLMLSLLVSLPVLRAMGLSLGLFWDAATITLLIGMVFTRVGCLLNGCCAGHSTDGPLGLWLPNVNGVWCRRIPTQLLEAGLGAVLLVASLLAWDRVPFDGALFLANVAAYGVGRFGLELTRESNTASRRLSLHQGISIGLVSLALATFAAVAIFGLGGSQPRRGVVVRPVQAQGFGGNGSLEAWQLALAPVTVLAVLSLVRFVGCDHVFGLDELSPSTHPDDSPDYPATVLQEASLVAYWRLQETAETDPVGDEKGLVFGVYFHPTNAGPFPPARAGDLSPAGSDVVADRLKLQQPGLLQFEPEPDNHSIELFGGHAEISFSPLLTTASFSIEAVVLPGWDPLISVQNPARIYCVAEFCGIPGVDPNGNPSKQSGFGLYAGPDDLAAPMTGFYHWQFWMGDGTFFTRAALGALVEFTRPNYLVATYDSSTQELRLFVYYEGLDLNDVKTTSPGVLFAANPSARPLTIGVGQSLRTFNQGLRYPFRGRIQEVAFYNQPLPEERVMSHIAASLNL